VIVKFTGGSIEIFLKFYI